VAGKASLGGGANTDLDRLNAQLVQLRATYSELHPLVRAVKKQITALETRAHVDAQLQRLQEQRAQMQQRNLAFEQSNQKAPEVEVALGSLTRSHQGLQQQLSQARAKLAEAEIGERLEADRHAERFEVIEQASVPSQPSGPPRPLLFLGGAFGSLAAGIGVLVLAELLDPRIRTENDLLKHLELRPLATIPYVSTPREQSRYRRKLLAAAVSFAGLALTATAAVAVHLLYQPLPSLLGNIL
jgi:uncharacterized protein involved in exopolysaccharide biosynthesis